MLAHSNSHVAPVQILMLTKISENNWIMPVCGCLKVQEKKPKQQLSTTNQFIYPKQTSLNRHSML